MARNKAYANIQIWSIRESEGEKQELGSDELFKPIHLHSVNSDDDDDSHFMPCTALNMIIPLFWLWIWFSPNVCRSLSDIYDLQVSVVGNHSRIYLL